MNRTEKRSSWTVTAQPLHEMTYTSMDQLGTYVAPIVNGQPSTTTWAYDDDGDLDDVTLPGGTIIDHTPDSAGRPGTIALPSGLGTISFGYDPTTGQLTSLGGPAGVSLTLGYNGRLLTDQTWSGMNLPTTTVHHDYYDTFLLREEAVNGAHLATFGYDDDGLLTSAGGMMLQRNPQTGQLDGSTLGAVVDDYERNAHGEVTHYEVKVNGAVVFTMNTPRDALGRIDSRTEAIGAQTSSIDYVYDLAGRLEDVKDLGTNQVLSHYDYDPNGNRLGRTGLNGTETGTHDDQDRLSTYGGRTYAYTHAGSLESVTEMGVGTTAYTYDALGGLRHVALPSGIDIDYIVDGAGRRIWKKRNGNLEQGFVYADDLRPVAELNGLGQVVARFVYGRHRNVPDLMIKNGATYRIVTDHLGSPRLVIHAQTGAIVQRMDYDEYGRVLSDSAPGFQPFGFAGGIYDTDTELVRFGARDYDAFTGRWTAKDPILFAGEDVNLYVYVLGDPVNYYDPHGELGILATAIVGGLVGGGIDLAGQLISNGGNLACVNWGSVGKSLVIGAALGAVGRFATLGREISIGKNLRIAPFGNRAGHPIGRWPHYHRRGLDASGAVRRNQGIGRHRPWEHKPGDTSIWDRF